MDKTRAGVEGAKLEGLRVLVVGLGSSGLAAARLAVARDARVTACDLRREEELGARAEEARRLGVEVRAGVNPPELVSVADLVVLSPGVPTGAPLPAEARRLGVPVWGEVEMAARFVRGRIIAVTGSNGKSTVTTMTGTILRVAGVPGGTGGNLGTPLSDLLTEDSPASVHAVELSSFQLETVSQFRPAVSVLLNLTPDHLDRYSSLDEYARAKARVLEVQAPDGDAVLNADDPACVRFYDSVRGRLHLFSTRNEVERGAFLRNNRLVLRGETGDEEVMAAGDLPVPGAHNVANALAAALACRLVGVETKAIARGLRAFRALPHRLQRVAELDGVTFYDDSKATNLDATLCALESFEPGTIHVILGGKDKGADWRSLRGPLQERARRVLLVGRAAETIEKAIYGVVPVERCGTVPVAVERGFRGAHPGDVVLLAPGCASFDQYRNYEERGDDFGRAVLALAGRRGSRA